MYLSTLGWDEGVAEFDRREGPGRDDVERIFGRAPSCYGQPGSSWGPQSYGAMSKWGMGVYLDAGKHVGLDGKPCYYDGVLNLYKLDHIMRTDLTGLPAEQQAEDRFAEARKALLAEGGGVVSIFYHPCEFVHKEFWDGVNFAKGANPPREQWKLPPQKTPEETKTAYESFETWIRFMKRFDDVQFITASEAAKLYRDRARGRKFTPAELKTIAAAVGDDVSFQRKNDDSLSASEVFSLLNDYVAERAAGRTPDALQLKETPYGPTSDSPALPEAVHDGLEPVRPHRRRRGRLSCASRGACRGRCGWAAAGAAGVVPAGAGRGRAATCSTASRCRTRSRSSRRSSGGELRLRRRSEAVGLGDLSAGVPRAGDDGAGQAPGVDAQAGAARPGSGLNGPPHRRSAQPASSARADPAAQPASTSVG